MAFHGHTTSMSASHVAYLSTSTISCQTMPYSDSRSEFHDYNTSPSQGLAETSTEPDVLNLARSRN